MRHREAQQQMVQEMELLEIRHQKEARQRENR